jgi:hypothetical protein
MKKYIPTIITLGFFTIVGAKFLTVKEYCLCCLAQGHAFFGEVRCLKLCDNICCYLSQGYADVVAAPGNISGIFVSVISSLF